MTRSKLIDATRNYCEPELLPAFPEPAMTDLELQAQIDELFYVVKAGQVHSFRNISNAPARIRTQIIPGNEGFENSLRILYGLASDGLYQRQRKAPRGFEHLAVCMSMSDTRLAGPLSFLNRMFGIVAVFARWHGVDKRLLVMYCQ